MPGGIHPPASEVASWSKDFDGPTETHGFGIIIASVVLWVVAFIVLITRLVARMEVRRCLLVADWLVIVAMIPLTGLNVAVILGVKLYGFDRHVWDLTPELLIAGRKTVVAIDVLYVLATGLLKLSILFFYLDLSARTKPLIFRCLVFTTMTLVTPYIVAFLIVIFLTARPFSAFWWAVVPEWYRTHPDGEEWSSIDEGRAVLAITVISVVQDFIVCLLPIQLIWNLQIATRKKIATCALCGAGIIVCAMGIARAIITQRIYYDTYDVTWHAYYAFIFTLLEANLAVVCASVPSLKVYFVKLSDAVTGPISRTYRRYSPIRGLDGQATATAADTTIYVPNKAADSVRVAVRSDDEDDSGDPETGRLSPMRIQIRREVQVRSDAVASYRTAVDTVQTSVVAADASSRLDLGGFRLSTVLDVATFSCEIEGGEGERVGGLSCLGKGGRR